MSYEDYVEKDKQAQKAKKALDDHRREELAELLRHAIDLLDTNPKKLARDLGVRNFGPSAAENLMYGRALTPQNHKVALQLAYLVAKKKNPRLATDLLWQHFHVNLRAHHVSDMSTGEVQAWRIATLAINAFVAGFDAGIEMGDQP